MILLTNAADLIQAITDAAADIEVHISYADKVAATEPVAGRTNPAHITTATTTTILSGPASGSRNVKHLNLHNNHATQSCLVRLTHYDATSLITSELGHATLLPGESLALNQNGRWAHYNRNMAVYSNTVFAEEAAFGVTGTFAETMPRQLCTETNTAALTSGTLFLQAIYLKRGQIVSNISFFSATTAAVTPTNGFFGLYSGALAKLAESANFTTEAWAANTIKTKAMTAPYTAVASGLYYLAIMITAATVPTLKGNAALTGGQLQGTAPILHGNSDAGLTTSIPANAAAITAGTTTIWGAVS